MTEDWKTLTEVSGMPVAEILRGLLEAQEIPVMLFQEGAGRALALTVGPLASVTVMVPTSELARAQQVLDDYQSGAYEPSSEEPDTDQAEV
jgi:hypothetical protein